MKKHMRLMTAALAVLLLASVSCGTESEAAETAADTTIAVETEPEITDNLPDKDFGGAEYKILSVSSTPNFENAFYDLEESGDVLDDAVYNRNRTVEERFNIDLIYDIQPGYSGGMANVKTLLTESVMSADMTYDLFTGTISYVSNLCADNLFSDMSDMDYLGFGQPWWCNAFNEELELAGHQFLAAGYFCMENVSFVSATFFNKELAAQYNVPDLYQLVADGKWTYASLFEIAASVTSDVNGDGKMGDGDIYGLASSWDYLANFGIAFDYKFTERDKDGKITVKDADDKVTRINEMFYEIFNHNLYCEGNDLPDFNVLPVFSENHALLLYLRLADADTPYLRGMSGYGILPSPKYDESQEKYISNVVGEVAGIPLVVKDSEMSAIVLEALTFETWKNVRPVYYDIVLKNKYSSDEITGHMIDLIFENITCEFMYMYDKIFGGTPTYELGRNENFTSYMASNRDAWQKKLDSFIDTLEANVQ